MLGRIKRDGEKEEEARVVFIRTRHLYVRAVNNMMEYRTKKVCMLKDHFSKDNKKKRLNIDFFLLYYLLRSHEENTSHW